MTRLWLAVVATAWGSAALANDARIMTVDDAAGEEGRVTVLPYDGVLPESPNPKLAIPQMPGFPVQMGSQFNFKPARGIAFADLDGDGGLEIIGSSTDSKVYAWDYTGKLMTGFPVSLIGWAQYAPTVADMDGDGDVEIVQPTRGQTSGGRLYVIDHAGAVLPGFPISMSNDNLSNCATVYDLDGDGTMEIIIGQRDYPIGYIHVVRLDGSEWGGNWPVAIDHVPAATASVGDIDADGSPEIIYLSYDSIFVLNVDGTAEAGWPKQILNCNFSYQSPALADLDDDGDLEIVVGAHKNGSGCYVFHHDGTPFPGWPKLVGTWTYCPPTVTDLEGDGILEILDGRAGSGPGVYSNCFWAWESDGSIKPGFPYAQAHGGGTEGPITVADIDGDGMMEIFTDHNIQDGDGGYLFGVDASGNDLPGFPLRPQGFTYLNGAMIADVDGDGDYELGVISNEDYVANVNLYDLADSYQATDRDWLTYHGRNERGGLYGPGVDCVGDLDGDGVTDLSDLGILLASYEVDDGGDLDGDGDTDLSDLGILLADYECGT